MLRINVPRIMVIIMGFFFRSNTVSIHKYLFFFDSSWSANTVIGPPRVYPQHGDLHGAWASSAIDDRQFIEVREL